MREWGKTVMAVLEVKALSGWLLLATYHCRYLGSAAGPWVSIQLMSES